MNINFWTMNYSIGNTVVGNTGQEGETSLLWYVNGGKGCFVVCRYKSKGPFSRY